jgi:hypothetical protein
MGRACNTRGKEMPTEFGLKNPEGKKPLRICRHTSEDSIRMEIRDTGCAHGFDTSGSG